MPKSMEVYNCMRAMVAMRFISLAWFTFTSISFFLIILRRVKSRTSYEDSLIRKIHSRRRDYIPEKDDALGHCMICMNDFSANKELQVVELECSSNHVFHLNCLIKWLSTKTNDDCPLCR